jgi:hypothetical protein
MIAEKTNLGKKTTLRTFVFSFSGSGGRRHADSVY